MIGSVEVPILASVSFRGMIGSVCVVCDAFCSIICGTVWLSASFLFSMIGSVEVPILTSCTSILEV